MGMVWFFQFIHGYLFLFVWLFGWLVGCFNLVSYLYFASIQAKPSQFDRIELVSFHSGLSGVELGQFSLLKSTGRWNAMDKKVDE
jgi:signal transduction histidine kinase